MKKAIILGLLCLLAVGVERVQTATAETKPKATSGKTKAPMKKPAKAKSGKKATAAQALDGARTAFAAMTKAARADEGLDPKKSKNKPFWKATRDLAGHLDRAEKGLAAKNDDFFKGVSDARAAEAQLKVDWQLTGSKNKRVIDNSKKLGDALAVLRTNFSKEAARKEKGGPLTAKEKEQFAQLKKQQTALLSRIAVLEKKAGKDKALEHGLKKMKSEATEIAEAPDTVPAFVAALYALDGLRGLIFGYDYYIDPVWRADWVSVATFATEWTSSYSQILSSETYSWTEVTESVDLYTSQDYAVSETITAEEARSQQSWAQANAVDMTDAEKGEVAEAQDDDPAVDSDDAADDDSMFDESDDEGEDFDEAADDGADDDDDAHDADDSDDGNDSDDADDAHDAADDDE